jgi:hypothetical protein
MLEGRDRPPGGPLEWQVHVSPLHDFQAIHEVNMSWGATVLTASSRSRWDASCTPPFVGVRLPRRATTFDVR